MKKDSKQSKNIFIDFYKRFANGEQNIKMTPDGVIYSCDYTYYWQHKDIFNLLPKYINVLKETFDKENDFSYIDYNEIIYGENGFVSQVYQLQVLYNELRNAKNDYLIRLTQPSLQCEDGSVDIDALEENGLAPGKVLIYRSGAQCPIFEQYPIIPLDYWEKELSKIEEDIKTIYQQFLRTEVWEDIWGKYQDSKVTG